MRSKKGGAEDRGGRRSKEGAKKVQQVQRRCRCKCMKDLQRLFSRDAEVQRCRGGGAEVERCRCAEEVQRWRGAEEELQVQGSAVVIQKRCCGPAEVVQVQVQLQVMRICRGCAAEVVLVQRFRVQQRW